MKRNGKSKERQAARQAWFDRHPDIKDRFRKAFINGEDTIPLQKEIYAAMVEEDLLSPVTHWIGFSPTMYCVSAKDWEERRRRMGIAP